MLLVMRAWVLSIAVLAAGGCRMVEPQAANKLPLAPLSIAPEAITLEVFSAPATPDDPEFDKLWQMVDEQSLPTDVRRSLAANGLRAGVVGPNIPSELAQVLKVTDQRVEEEDRQSVSMDPEGGVVLRVLHIQAGKRSELAIPEIREKLTLLEASDGQAHGKNYQQAECRLGLRAFPQSDGRVRLQLTPELHHGQFKSHVRGSDGMLMWTQEREKRIFSDLQLEPQLAAGQMLVISRRPECPKTAGWHFFTKATGEKPQAMLWAFRVARAAPDTAFYDGPAEDDVPALTNDQTE